MTEKRREGNQQQMNLEEMYKNTPTTPADSGELKKAK